MIEERNYGFAAYLIHKGYKYELKKPIVYIDITEEQRKIEFKQYDIHFSKINAIMRKILKTFKSQN